MLRQSSRATLSTRQQFTGDRCDQENLLAQLFTAKSSVPNNTDVANLYDASGSYTFTATGGTSTAANTATFKPNDGAPGYTYGVNSLQTINAYSVGADTAELSDSVGNDTFVGTPTSVHGHWRHDNAGQ